MAGGFWGGFTQGVNERLQTAQGEDKERALALLKGIIEGNVTQKTPEQMQTAGIRPPNISQRIMSGLGLKPSPEADINRYNVMPNMNRQLQAENLRYTQNINKQMEGGTGTEELIYRDATGREISPDVAQADIAKGNTNYYISRKDISKSGIKEAIVSKPEDLEKSRAISEKSQFILDQAQDSLDTIAEIKKGMGYFGAGSLVPAIPTLQPEKVNWQVNVNKLLSGKMIDLMTKMKEASKTGATGFGQLSEKEGQILREASTALKKTLSPKDAQRYLNIMEKSLNKIISTKTNIQSQQLQPTEDFSQMSDEELRSIVSGGQ